MIYIPIGGNCNVALAVRKELKLSEIALPFDYLRSNFKCIIENISSKFEKFLPDIDTHEHEEKGNYVGDYDHFVFEDVVRYHLENHSFWHHNLQDSNVMNAFRRRIDRFNTLLSSPPDNYDEITFLRVVISKTIMEEVHQHTLFMDCVEKMNPALKYKLIFICDNKNNDSIIRYKKINDKCALIVSPSVQNGISFYQKFGFCQSDGAYENETMTECTIEYSDEDINLGHMDINIHGE